MFSDHHPSYRRSPRACACSVHAESGTCPHLDPRGVGTIFQALDLGERLLPSVYRIKTATRDDYVLVGVGGGQR